MKTMCAKIVRNLVLAVSFVTLGISLTFAQAVFKLSSSPGTAADIGYAELAGPIVFTVSSGTGKTVAAPILIVYSAPITNNDASEISVIGTGGLSVVASSPVLDRTANSILINVPAEGTGGNQISVYGVRLAVAGLNVSQVSAFISSPTATGNSFAGQLNPVVIASIMQPFSIDESVASPLSFSNGVVTRPSTSFLIAENYLNAFTSNIGIAGQTVATRIRITPFPDIPEGIQITFPPIVTSDETGARFTTLSGQSETIPRADGSTDVTYSFAAAEGSSVATESFAFTPTMTVDPSSLGSGTIRFQAELIPIGLATPNQEFPSTDIPRYAERILPDEADLIFGSSELVFPFRIQSDETYTGIAVTNPLGYKVGATLTAYDAGGNVISGDGIMNSVPITIPANGQYYAVASDIFGSAFNASSAGTIHVAGRTPLLKGIYLTGDISGPRLDAGVGDAQASLSWYLPVVFHQGDGPFNSLEIYNPGSSDAHLNLRLMDASGTQKTGTIAVTVVAGGLTSGSVTQIFGIDQSSFQGGYIRGDSDNPLIARENFGNSLESNVLDAQRAIPLTSFTIPFFASGGQYSTELTLVNTDSLDVADVTVALLNDSGAATADPVTLSLNPKTQRIDTIAGLFPALGSGLVSGSIRVNVKPASRAFFVSVPAVVGAVRYLNSNGSASTSVALVNTSGTDFVYSYMPKSSAFFTGLAMVNSGSKTANFTVQVYKEDGAAVGRRYTSSLQPGRRVSKLLDELVPGASGQGDYFRITSDAGLTIFAVFASNDLRSMSAIPPQILQ
jgi:hypothetical protein